MWSKLVAKLAVRALNMTILSVEDRNLLTAAILNTLQALPLHAILEQDESGAMIVQGKPLDVEKGRQLRDGAAAALRNPALLLIREQITYTAFVGASITSKIPEDLLFYRAALWWGQETEKLLKLLAQRSEEPDL